MKEKVKFGISLYSWADSFSSGRMTLEETLKASRDIGYTGISIVAAQHCREYPFISDRWLYTFREGLEKYGLEPVMWEGYLDVGRRQDRDMTEDEIINFTFNDMVYAKKAGFSQMKTQHSITPDTLVKMIPLCRELDMKLTVEMHWPHHLRVPVWQEYIKAFTDPASGGYLGVVPDFSVWQFTPHELHIRQALDEGARRNVIDEAAALMRERKTMEETLSAIKNLNPAETKYIGEFYHKFGTPAPLTDFGELLKYSTCIHGKYYYINDSGDDPSIPFAGLMGSLRQSGYEGYVLAEYEGHHYYIDGVDEVEQNRRGLELMRKSFEGGGTAI